MSGHMTPQQAREAALQSADRCYGVLMRRGTMELGYYCPQESDAQQPHDQDEIYIIHTGCGLFLRGDERIEFGPGDALFVAAGVAHRFVEFSKDFAAWVVFYGPTGGEPAS